MLAGKRLLPAASYHAELSLRRLACEAPREHRGFAPHLVVHHNVDSAMRGVGGKVTQVERLIHNALPSKCSVPMQEDGHHLGDMKPQQSAGALPGQPPGNGKSLIPMSLQHPRKDTEQLINASSTFSGDGSGASCGWHSHRSRLWPRAPPLNKGNTLGGQHPMHRGWEVRPIPKHTPQSKAFNWGKTKQIASFPHPLTPEELWAEVIWAVA